MCSVYQNVTISINTRACHTGAVTTRTWTTRASWCPTPRTPRAARCPSARSSRQAAQPPPAPPSSAPLSPPPSSPTSPPPDLSCQSPKARPSGLMDTRWSRPWALPRLQPREPVSSRSWLAGVWFSMLIWVEASLRIRCYRIGFVDPTAGAYSVSLRIKTAYKQ